MKKNYKIWIGVLGLAVALFTWMGVGYRPSASAVADLRAELTVLHGEEYSAKICAEGTEDMTFSIQPKNFFFTNWDARNFFGKDYEYECIVTYTTYAEGKTVKVHTISYRAFDPMGMEKSTDRAYLDLSSKTEKESLR